MSAKREFLVYVGTACYTGEPSRDIHGFRFDASTGKVASLGVVGASLNPGTLAIHPSGQFLYASNELGDYKGTDGGGISAFAIDKATGKLSFLNDVLSGGAYPAFVTVDATGKYAITGNYSGGKVVVFPVLADGGLGDATASAGHEGSSVNKERQEGPHPHSVYVSPDNRFVIACDLGLDKIFVFRFDAIKGSLIPNHPPFANVNPGAGPRHLAFSPNGAYAYVINELQSTVSAFSYDGQKGVLHHLDTISTLPPDYEGEKSGAEIAVSTSGKFLYTSNRVHDSITVFAIDADRGTLKPVDNTPTRGKTPRGFAIDPTGSYMFVANEISHNIVIFRIDAATGLLSPTAHVLEAVAPTSIAFLPL
jgi:6-phosphogluconolactonase